MHFTKPLTNGKPISQRRLDATRAIAGVSGPKPPSFRHTIPPGTPNSRFIIDGEDIDQFHELRDTYMARFAAADQVEIDLIDSMVHATWNGQRAVAMETELINRHMRLTEDHLPLATRNLP